MGLASYARFAGWIDGCIFHTPGLRHGATVLRPLCGLAWIVGVILGGMD